LPQRSGQYRKYAASRDARLVKGVCFSYHTSPWSAMDRITFDDFTKVDIRVGRVVRVEPFPKARKPAWKLWVDFGELGIRKSSAQLTALYTAEQLLGRLVLAVVNFPPRQVADFMSEVLVLSVPLDTQQTVVLIGPDRDVPLGGRLF
jgi:tRNA-binding protein